MLPGRARGWADEAGIAQVLGSASLESLGAQAFVATCKYGSMRRFAPQVRPFRVSEGSVQAAAPDVEGDRSTAAATHATDEES